MDDSEWEKREDEEKKKEAEIIAAAMAKQMKSLGHSKAVAQHALAQAKSSGVLACANCLFFARKTTDSGQCRAVVPMLKIEGSNERTSWPQVWNDDWCCHFLQESHDAEQS